MTSLLDLLTEKVQEKHLVKIIIEMKKQMEIYQLKNDLLEKYDNSWSLICQNQILSEKFIREFKDEMIWEIICETQTLSEKFIREFKDEMIWSLIYVKQTLSKEFIKEFENEINKYKNRVDKHLIYNDNPTIIGSLMMEEMDIIYEVENNEDLIDEAFDINKDLLNRYKYINKFGCCCKMCQEYRKTDLIEEIKKREENDYLTPDDIDY